MYEENGVTEYVFGTLQTSMTASPPDGETLTVSGILSYGGIFYADSVEASSWLAATVHYPAASGWLADVTSSDMNIYINPSESGGSKLELLGGYSIGGATAYFDTLTFEDGCVTGALRTRDARGAWYVLTLSDCSGCGQVVVGETDLGEACIDLTEPLTTLIDVMVAPP